MLNGTTECNWGDRAIARPMQRNGSTINDISIQSDALSGARFGTGKMPVPQKKDFFYLFWGEILVGCGTGSPARSTKKRFF